MNTIESLMREMEEDRRQRRIAALSDTTQADGGVWKVEPSPNACPTCLEFSRKTYAEKPNPPHPNCKCRISKQEKKKRYYVIGRRPLDGLGSVSTTKLDWIKKWDKNTYKSGKGGLPALLPEHRHFFDSEGNDFGFFSDDNVRPDRKRNLPSYTYGDVKYDADIIDRAVRKYETYINQVQEKNKHIYKINKRYHNESSTWTRQRWELWTYFEQLPRLCQQYFIHCASYFRKRTYSPHSSIKRKLLNSTI